MIVTKLPAAAQRAIVDAARESLSSAKTELTHVVTTVRQPWVKDVTDDTTTFSIIGDLNFAYGRVEGLRQAGALKGADQNSLWNAISQLNEANDKVYQLSNRSHRWAPMYDMIASDAKKAVEFLDTFDASLAKLQK